MYEFKATHHGKMFGVPVYLDMREPESPAVKPKYGYIGEAAFFVMECLFGCFTWTQTVINPEYEPLFPIYVGKPV